MENISSIIQSVQKDMIELNHDIKKQASHNIFLNKQQFKNSQAQKQKLLQKKADTSKDEKKLKYKKNIQLLEKWIGVIKNQMRLSKKDLKKAFNDEQKSTKQLLKILNDIDSIQTRSLNQNTEGGSAALSVQSQSMQALEGSILAAKSTQISHNSEEASQHQKTQNKRSQSISLIQKQIKSLKALKIVKTVFGIAKVGASFIPGAGNIIVKAALSLQEYLITKEYSKSIKKSGKAEAQTQKSLQQQMKFMKEQVQKNQKSEAFNQKNQNILERALIDN